jgi:hypothetical protein
MRFSAVRAKALFILASKNIDIQQYCGSGMILSGSEPDPTFQVVPDPDPTIKTRQTKIGRKVYIMGSFWRKNWKFCLDFLSERLDPDPINYSGSDLGKMFRTRPDPDPQHWYSANKSFWVLAMKDFLFPSNESQISGLFQVVLLGLYKGQKLESNYEVLVRITPGKVRDIVFILPLKNRVKVKLLEERIFFRYSLNCWKAFDH